MSDKSFGDHSNRNIVKNPLLSSAVTGLSLEDLTHKAVLLPVNPTLGQITRSDQEQGAQTRTLAHAGHESQVLPSGDALSNITLSPTTQITNPNILDSEYNVKLEKNCDTPNVTQSKALTKSDDDFDVNEYIARLQGSRYVSAPLHSHHKDDQNANLDATEENLEEINLNESQSPVEVQQSLTADIAQNFSQLPTVLPHVASAVFSSFSNMLSYKSREQTPDRHNVMPQHEQRSKGYDEVQFQRPDVGIPVMGMEEFSVPKEVAPPPKEPPIGGTSNFRITTKKKYAQIPGLSSGDATQSMTPPCQNIGFGHNMPPTSQIIPSISQMPPYGQNIPPPAQNAPAAQHMLHVEQPQNDLNMPPFSENVPPTSQNRPALAQNALPFNQNLPPYVQNAPPISQSISPIGVNVPSFLNPSGAQVGDSTKYKADDASSAIAKPQESIIQNAAASHLRYNILNPFNAESPSVTSEMSASESRANLFAVTKDTQHFFTPIEHKGQATQNIPSKPNVPGSASIIPPPPMFSNLPRRDSQSGVGKSVLPPSVARRISANQPIIKPAVSAPSFSENIFVPPSVSEASKEISSHVENIFSTGTLTSAFVPAHTTSIKLDPIGPSPSSIPPPSQINVPFRIPPVMPQASAPATFFIPSNDDKSQISTAFANPLPDSKFTPGPNMDLQTQSYVQPSILQPMLRNDQTPPALFNPLYAEPAPQNALNQITQMPPVTISEPPKPVVEPPKATANVNYRMIKKRPQYYAGPIEGVGPISNNVKPVIAPIIPSATHAEVSNFQGAFFIPDQPLQPATEQYGAPNIKQSSVPFDICAQGENVTSHVPFDISKPQEQAYGSPFDIRPPQTQTLGQDFNTAFDMSRATSDTYDPPKQESTGFGIIGSLKSKLSSIDINKIQNTVTTFFDPAYNEAKVEESATLENTSYGRQQKFGQSSQDQSSFDIYVPPVEHNQYSQFKHVGYDYSPKYNQTQEPVAANRDQNVYSTSSYFTDPNYSTEQVHTTNPLYDNTQAHLPAVIPDTQMSKSIDNAPFYDPSAFAQKSTANIINYKPSCKDQFKPDAITATLDLINPSSTINQSQQEFEQGKMHTSDTASVKAENATHSNPNAFSQASSQMLVNPQQYFDMYASSRPMVNLNKNKSSVSVPDEKEQPTFYNPNTFSFENQQTPTTQTSHALTSDNQQKTYPFSNDISSNASVTTNSDQIENLPICDSALNTSKYNMVNIQSKSHQNIPTRSPLVPASSFFDQTGSLPTFSKNDEIDFSMQSHALANDEIRYIAEQQEQFDSKNIEINKMLSETPVPISSKAANKYDQNKEGEEDCEKLSKENTSKESLSKGNLPILGVSTIPLFGLPALIGDRSREISEPANEAKRLPSTETSLKTRNLFEANTGINFFESIAPEQLPEKVLSIHENIAKGIPSDISGLSITDVKNVLLIEPPQENIGTVLKRNASSTKLETLLKSEEVSPEHYKRQNDSLPSTEFQEKLNLKIDETANEVFFKHLETTENELKSKKIPKDTSVKHQENENSPDLNICETCREVKTPDAGHDQNNKEIDDFTAQLIENITSNMSLSNPLTVPFSDGDAPIVDERSRFEDQQFDEITHIAEDTIETLQVQSAIDLLDDEITTSEVRNFGWTTEDAVYSAKAHVAHDYGFKLEPDDVVAKDKQYNFKMDPNTAVKPDDHDYEFKLDPNAIGFFGNNSLFFEQLPTNASDEIKAEIKHSHEEVVLPRQMSIPTAPPAEDDTKSDETGGLDVHSIEQDAKKDFPLEEEFIIEPSETDDDKIECRERKKSSDDSTLIDTFTNRVERFKKAADHDDSSEHKGAQGYGSPPISMASYFDTGNYAVESHYRNSLNSPTSINTFQFSTNTIRIPPGFEEEYARRLSGMSLSSGENRNEPCIPDTSTQTRTTSAITYCSSQETNDNVIGSEMRRKEHTEVGSENKSETNNLTITSESVQATSNFVTVDPVQSHSALFAPPVQPDVIPLNVQSLPDPINFFSANVEDAKPTEAAEESVNRLASYFSMPAAQPDHSKSFFELSQSQNHYRHKNKESDSKVVQKPFFELSQGQNHYIDDATKHNITDLMKDLTSPRHLQEQIVRTVNYFTIELNNEIKHNTSAAPINVKILDENKIPIDSKTDSKTNVNNTILVGNDCKDIEPIIECKYCISNIPGINTNYLKVRTANDSTVTKTETEMTSEKENNKERRPTVNFGSFDAEGQTQDGIAVINEHRTSSEYTPVKYHWFYRVDVEDKSVWRGFSRTDSRSLEDAFHSPNLTESTLVATDGGRFDVNVLGRLRLAVYWKEKPTNVRRCSWFYKGTTDARYVPYTEAVAEKLEEEYRHGVTTGEWHRRLSLPNSEMVIMHGPSVMVHFLHSGATDAFSTPPSLLGKRVYRNPPKINVARDQPETIDHLIFLVHGAGEHKMYMDQTTSRPRVVRRGHEESEIEDCEPSKIDHLLLLCHGVGSACDMRFRSVEEVVEDFRSTSLQLLESHYRNSFDNSIVSRVEVLPISWHAQLHSGETGVDRRLSRVTLDSIPRLRAFTNHTVLDVLFYTSPVFHQTIIDTVCSELNRIYSMFKQRNPSFKGEVSLGGHSLGSVILYDLLCHQMCELSQEPNQRSSAEKTYVPGTAASGQLSAKYPQLTFAPAALYALGSPIAIFECIRGVESLGMNFALPTCKNFFNIFHPYDPIAYRIEPLINPQLEEVKPSQIPHHKGRKRMHLELKDTMLRVGTDLKQKLIESLRTTWNKWKASPPIDGQLEKVVEEEIEKEQLCDDNKEEQAAEVELGPESLGRLNDGRRVDYVLQEAPLEMINEYLFAMTSHVGYWESEDTMLLMLREIYSSLGVQPDSTVPQQSMTVQRTRTLSQDEANVINEKEYPSTSRGST